MDRIRNTARRSASGWVWTAANIGLVLVVVLLAALLWLSHRWDLEEQRRNLIADILWAEQNFRFRLQGDEASLLALGQEAFGRALAPADFEVRVRHLVSNNPEVEQVTLLDAAGEVAMMFPVPVDRDGAKAPVAIANTRDAQRLALSLGKPAYSDVYKSASGEPRFALHAPIYRNGKLAGQIMAEYSPTGMLRYLVPWWYAEKYQLAILDTAGSVLASKSNVKVEDAYLTYQVALDPPGGGIAVRATAYAPASSLTRSLFLTAIIVLSTATLWSLLALRRDMQRRLAAEKELLAHHAFRQAMEDSMLTGIQVRDLDGRISYVNPAFCRMTGFAADELIGHMPPHPYWAPETEAATNVALKRVLAGDAPAEGLEVRYRRKNGERLDVLVQQAPLIDGDGRQSGWMGSVLDITERKRSDELARQQREQLQLNSRLVTMGEMASTLAHELNQPLSAITSYATGALNKLDSGTLEDSDLRRVLDTTAKSGEARR